MSSYEIIKEARRIINEEGLGPALRFLNKHGRHRFTALYKFDGDTLRNLYLVDRDDPTVENAPDAPVLETYCVFVRRTGKRFKMDDSQTDERAEGHSKRDVVQSYLGIPLMDHEGMFGTLCHFDYEAVPFSDEEVTTLDDLAPDILRVIRQNNGAINLN